MNDPLKHGMIRACKNDPHLLTLCFQFRCFTSLFPFPDYIEDHCDQMLNLNYGGVEVVRLLLTKSEKYPDGMRCRMIIQAPEEKRLLMRIEDFDLDANTVFQNNQNNPSAQITPQQCGNGDYALLYDGPDENSLPLLGKC